MKKVKAEKFTRFFGKAGLRELNKAVEAHFKGSTNPTVDAPKQKENKIAYTGTPEKIAEIIKRTLEGD